MTAWSIFPRSAKYFGTGEADFTLNYCVDDLDALLDELKQAGVQIDPHREDCDYGSFAWIPNPDGNRIELWGHAEDLPRSSGQIMTISPRSRPARRCLWI